MIVMSEFDSTIKGLVQNDKLGFEPDPKIELRLLNHLQMKAAYSKPRQNMIIPFISTILSTKLIGLKIVVAATIVIGFAGFKQLNNHSAKIINRDTCSAYEKSDSVGYLKVMDSTSYN